MYFLHFFCCEGFLDVYVKKRVYKLLLTISESLVDFEAFCRDYVKKS